MIQAITREEIFLAKAVGETVPDLEPIIRQEMFLAKIAGMDIATPVPVTREEMFLNAIANKEAIDLKPITRKEMFLAKAMGADVEVPTPITRVEFYLSQLTGGSSGGGTYEKYSWEGVFASIDKGTYATDYAIGDMIPLDLGSEGLINMQIAAFDTDDLADGSGKAPITWLATQILPTKVCFNPAYSAGVEGTGAEGGWGKSELRSYMNTTIFALIPENVRNRIHAVSKKHMDGSTSVAQTTADKVWVPSVTEASESHRSLSAYSKETGAFYPASVANNVKIDSTITAGTIVYMWARTAISKTQPIVLEYRATGKNCDMTTRNSETLNDVRLCFCT